MILTLFIVSLFFILLGVFNFIKKKPVLGWFFLLLGIMGFALGVVVVWLYPNTI